VANLHMKLRAARHVVRSIETLINASKDEFMQWRGGRRVEVPPEPPAEPRIGQSPQRAERPCFRVRGFLAFQNDVGRARPAAGFASLTMN
jgi:hypothetical protein